MPESAAAMAGQVRQHMQENEQERVARKESDFPDFEHGMPDLTNRFQFSLKDNLSSYLGSRNPFYTLVNPEDHLVWLLDNTAYQTPGGEWKAELVAAYFAKGSGKDTSKIVAYISDKIGLAKGNEAEKTIAKRVQPLLDAILPAHAVNVDIVGKHVRRLGPSGRDGISVDEVILPRGTYTDSEALSSKAVHADATPMNTTFATSSGWAVISDIDDTIKKTLTSSPIGILKTTFAETPEAIKGMPEFYKYMSQKLDTPPFWYLSASPYNLYPFLREFRETYYPPGTLILREASWMNLAGLLGNLTQGTEAYKTDRMEKIHGWFPFRKFVCIGDSTQTDPESYGSMYRKYPGWIGAIFIRKVTGVAEMDEEQKNGLDRFKKAFEGVGEDVWHVFEDPSELYEKLDKLVGA